MNVAFEILGMPFRADGVDQGLARWLERFWRFPYRLTPRDPSIHMAPGAVTVPPGEPERLTMADGAVLLWRHGDDHLLAAPGSAARLRATLDTRRVALTWTGEPQQLVPALHLALAEVVRGAGLLPLHAAVAARGEEAVAFLAASGSGKTTTLLKAVAEGWSIAADDFAWVDPRTMLVYGWDRDLGVLPDTLEAFSDLFRRPGAGGVRWHGPEGGARGKKLLAYESTGWAWRTPVRLTSIFVLAPGRDATTPDPSLTPRDAALALWDATGLAFTAQGRAAAAEAIPRILESVPPRRLAVSRTGPLAL